MHCCNINKSRRGGIFIWFTWQNLHSQRRLLDCVFKNWT